MKNVSLYWFYKVLENDNQCLLFNGSFSNSLTSKIIGLSEANQKNYQEDFKTQRRVSYLLGECFQNIIKHGENETHATESENGTNFFMNRNCVGKHYIVSANQIKADNIDVLKQQIDSLNTMDKAELKELHKHTIKHGSLSDRGGAGLGLIDMARKSGHKIDYKFVKYDKESSVFYNQIILESGGANEGDVTNVLPVDVAVDFHNRLQCENILMVQKGDFSQDSIMPVLNLIEKLVMTGKSGSKKMKNIYRVLVEVLQNINKHAYSINELKEGMFSISRRNDGFVVSAANFIEVEKAEGLSARMNELNGLDAKEVEDLYAEILLTSLEEIDNVGLGLVNLLQVSKQSLGFSFDKFDTQKSLFTIQVTI